MGVALVTGAGRGLGRAICERLAIDGHTVKAVDIDRESAEATATMVDGTAHRCDVGDAEAVQALAGEVGPVDILVNNAGVWRFGPILEASETDLSAVLRVNLLGTVHCCQAFYPGMADQGGGAIVNLSSAAAAMHASGVGIYPASKGAIELLTQQLAVELGPQSIRVNAVGPGLIVTEGTAANYEGDRQRERARAVPLQRVGRPTDIANVVAFLVSEQSGYVSGQIIYVDGGITAGRPSV